MEKLTMNENELAKRWGISPKSLQRWRSEGRGPKYLKLSKRVSYFIEDIVTFEYASMHSATWEKASDVLVCSDNNLMSSREIAHLTNIPNYVLTHPRVREALGVPCLYVGKLLRFKLDEIMAWMRNSSQEMKEYGIELKQDPTEQRRSLLQALAQLPA